LRFASPSQYNSEGFRYPDSSTAIQTVTSMITRAFKHQGATLSRAVGLLLVVFILYGTTVETAHRHGRFLPNSNSTTSFVDAGLAQNLTSGKLGCSDCLICQLHQNFSTSLIAFRQIDPPSLVRIQFRASPIRSFLSQANTPQRGRAPPFTALFHLS
jgi:hypothetical protein